MPAAVLIEKTFAALVVLACALLLLRQFIGARRRLRIDAVFGRVWRRARRAALRLYHWPAAHRRAQREAEAAIRRARGDARKPHDGDDDNVVRPKFGNSRKLH